MIRPLLYARLPRWTWPAATLLALGALSALLLARHGFGIEPRCAPGASGGEMQLAVVHESAACAQATGAADLNSAAVVLAVLALPVLTGYLAGAGIGCWLSIMVRAGLRRGWAGTELIARHVLRLVWPARLVPGRLPEAAALRWLWARVDATRPTPGCGTAASWRGPPRVALAG